MHCKETPKAVDEPKKTSAKECGDLTSAGQPQCEAPEAVKGKVCIWKDATCIEKPGTPIEAPKECGELTSAGQAQCEAPEAVKGKKCIWKDNTCVEKQALTKCEEITKDKNSCEAPDAIAGKACVWMAKKCFEKSEELGQFMNENRNFISKIAVNKGGPDVWGAGHGEVPDWEALCNIKNPSGHNRPLESLVSEVSLHFKKDTDQVQLVLDCTQGKGDKKTYDFLYSTKVLDKKGLLISLDLNGLSVAGKSGSPAKEQNQLEFFTKTPWFYTPISQEIKGASLLANMGYTNYKTIDPKSEKDIDEAFSYIKKDQWNVADDVGAIFFVFRKL